jgi:glutamate/tyrosine decarboxylase-like PLP-dependent enzyme
MVRRHVASPGYGELKRASGRISLGDHPRYRNLPDIQGAGETELAAQFLGPHAENEELFSEMVRMAISAASTGRRYFHPEDPPAVTSAMRHSPEYLKAVDTLKWRFTQLLQKLGEFEMPFYSTRYQGHMLRENTIPGMLGFFATMLHNPNNVTVQASALTTFLEMVVGEDLCSMLGYGAPAADGAAMEPWGHLTTDGSVANAESMWAAREVKYLPVAVRYAIANDSLFTPAWEVEVRVPDGSMQRLNSLDTWNLLNLCVDDILALPAAVAKLTDMRPSDVWEKLLASHSLNSIGWLAFSSTYMDGFSKPPLIVAPSTAHYSWPKAAALLGFGTAQWASVEVDPYARVNVDAMRNILVKAVGQSQPVVMVVSVMGSTEESAVDYLADILELRREFRAQGLEFVLHSDAAWGGYLISTLRKDFDQPAAVPGQDDEKIPADSEPFIADASGVHLSAHTKKHMMLMRESDSVTVDPHKNGFIHYPAGAICYRNTSYKNLLTFGAPVIGAPGTEPTVGLYGIEGSRPGACAAGVFLSHAVMRPSVSGYGKLLNRVLLNTRLFYLYVTFLPREGDPFISVPLAPLPLGLDTGARALELFDYARARGVEAAAAKFPALFNELGPDQNIVDYMFNIRHADGTVNRDLDQMNSLNQAIYDKFHIKPDDRIEDFDLMLTQTQMSTSDYGLVFLDSWAKRLGVDVPSAPGWQLNANRSVMMDPWPGEIRMYDTIFNVLRTEILAAIAAIGKPGARAAHV